MTDSSFFDRPILNSPYACPQRHWELDTSGQPTQRVLDSRRPAEFITPIPKPKKQKGRRKAGVAALRRGAVDPGHAVPLGDHQRRARRGRQVASAAQPGRLEGHARDRAAAPTLAASPVRRRAALLLPGRGGRDSDLAHGSRTPPRQGRPALHRAPGQRQPGGESGPRPSGSEAGHRGRQDHRDGDADRPGRPSTRCGARTAASSRAAS